MKNRLCRLLLATFVTVAALAPDAFAQAPRASRIDWLQDVSEIWMTARLFHPAAVQDPARWDAALLRVLRAMPAEPAPEAMKALVAEWLAQLGDPITGVALANPRDAPGAWTPRVETVRPKSMRVWLGDVPTQSGYRESLAKVHALGPRLAAADAVVFDLRTATPNPAAAYAPGVLVDASEVLAPLLASAPEWPEIVERYYSGHVAESGSGDGGYESGRRVRSAAITLEATGARDVRLVFVVNRHVAIPASAAALQREGRAVIVSEDAANMVSEPSVQVQSLRLGPYEIAVRASAVAWRSGAGFAPDRVVPAAQVEAAIAAVLERWPGTGPQPVPSAGRRRAQPAVVPPPEAADALPSREARLLAFFKTWWTIKLFFAYGALADRNWDEAPARFIPRFESATTHAEYYRALSELLAWTDDSHVILRGALVERLHGGVPPLAGKMVDGSLVVTAVAPAAQLGGAVVNVGDVVERVDGVVVARGIEDMKRLRAHSNAASVRNRAARFLWAGPVGTPVALHLRRADGRLDEVSLPRQPFVQPWRRPLTPVVELTPEGYGYADLSRIERGDVETLFERFKDTPALILDMRGYPRGTAWDIAARLSWGTLAPAAVFTRPVRVPGDARLGDTRESLTFVQRLPLAVAPRYAGLTVMLIDENAISQSEHAGLFLRAANKTLFIGSATMGANGDTTSFFLPGGLQVYFSGQEVRWPDGKALQRVGLQPDHVAEPTLSGIRAGRDEVLDAARDFVKARLRK